MISATKIVDIGINRFHSMRDFTQMFLNFKIA